MVAIGLTVVIVICLGEVLKMKLVMSGAPRQSEPVASS